MNFQTQRDTNTLPISDVLDTHDRLQDKYCNSTDEHTSETIKNDISKFAEIVKDRIKNIQNYNQIDLLTGVFSFWQSFLLKKFDFFIPSQHEYSIVISNDDIENVGDEYKDYSSTFINNIVNDAANSTDCELPPWLNKLHSILYNLNDGKYSRKGLDELQNRGERYIAISHFADVDIKSGRTEGVYIALREICKEVTENKAKDPLSIYGFSWALHLKGSLFMIQQDYERAAHFYELSMKAKSKLSFGFLHSVQSEICYNAALFHNNSGIAYENMKTLYENIVEESKQLGMEYYPGQIDQVKSDICRYFGYWTYLTGNREEGIRQLRTAMSIADRSKNGIRRWLAAVQLSICKVIADFEVQDIYDQMTDNEKHHPFVKMTLDAKYISDFQIIDQELYSKLNNVAMHAVA